MRNFARAKKPQDLLRLGCRLRRRFGIPRRIDELQFVDLAVKLAADPFGQLSVGSLDTALDATEVADVTTDNFGECVKRHSSFLAGNSKR